MKMSMTQELLAQNACRTHYTDITSSCLKISLIFWLLIRLLISWGTIYGEQRKSTQCYKLVEPLVRAGQVVPLTVQWELSECLFAFYRQKELFFFKTPEKYQYNSMTKYQLQKKISVHGFTRALNTPDTYFSPHSDLQQHCCLSCALILLPQAQSVLSPELWRPVFDSNNKIKEETGELAN